MDELTFRDEIKSQSMSLPRAALLFAREIANPRLEIDTYLVRLDWLAGMAGKLLSPADPVSIQAQGLADFLFHQFAFRGNLHDYSDPRNSFLNEVLDRRLGIPITLSVIYLAVAERLDLPAQGVGLPGHFIVRVPAPKADLFLDPFNGGARLTIHDCEQLVRRTTGYTGEFHPEWLQPSSSEEILARMLTNLKAIYLQGEAWEKTIAVIERLRLLQPEVPDHLRDLGLLHQRTGSLRLAVQFLVKYLQSRPDAPDAGPVRQSLETAAQALARLN